MLRDGRPYHAYATLTQRLVLRKVLFSPSYWEFFFCPPFGGLRFYPFYLHDTIIGGG
jgi:hypothetical protein